MRILVTKNGNIIIQEIDTSTSINNNNENKNYLPSLKRHMSSNHYHRIKKVTINSKFRNFKKNNLIDNKFLSTSKINKSNKPKSTYNTMINFNKKKKNFNLYDNVVTINKKPKYIKLNNHKLIFPKQFSDKYEKDNKESTAIISSSMKFYMPSITLKNSNTTNLNKKYYSFNDIISNENIIEMKKKLINEYKEKEKYEKITENNFRSIYKPESDLEKFNDLLFSPIIKSSKLSLIKYINQKKFNPKALKSLYERDPVDLDKMDQICKVYFINKEKDDKLNNFIKDKANEKMNNTKHEFQNIIKDAEERVEDFKIKLEKYNHKVNEKEKYREIFQDLKNKHWERFNLDRFNKKKEFKPRYIHSYLDKKQSISLINNII